MAEYALNILIYLLVLLMLLMAVRYCKWRGLLSKSPVRIGSSSTVPELTILNSVAVGGGQWVHLMECQGERFLVGTSPQGVSYLRECGKAGGEFEGAQPLSSMCLAGSNQATVAATREEDPVINKVASSSLGKRSL